MRRFDVTEDNTITYTFKNKLTIFIIFQKVNEKFNHLGTMRHRLIKEVVVLNQKKEIHNCLYKYDQDEAKCNNGILRNVYSIDQLSRVIEFVKNY